MQQLATLVFLLILVQAVSMTAQVQVSVIDFGATGDGFTDDRPAIQSAIDHVHSLGGGTVFFPAGTYIISPLPHPQPAQVICLKLYDNIQLAGVNRDVSIIKLQDNAPPFDAMIGNQPSYEAIDNVVLRHLCFDANGTHNPIADPSELSQGNRNIFRIFLGHNYLIEHCRFTRHKGVWCVVFNGLTEHVVIRHNEFTLIGDDSVEWDHSSIYTNGDDFLIEHNYFSTLSGPGTKAARAAIEIHGSNQIVRHNTIVAYPYGINITGYSELYPSYNQIYHNNVFQDVMNGMVLWSSASSNPEASNGLEDIRIFDNIIRVNSIGWQDYDFYDGGAGIVFERNRDLDIHDVYIFNNEVEFMGSPINSASLSRYSNGITMATNNYPWANVRHAYILNNRIKNSNGPGINIDSPLSYSIIAGNTLENAGSSLANLFTGFRCGFYVGDTITEVQINCNTLTKTDTTGSLHHALYNNGTLLSGAYYFNNNQNGYSISNFTNGSYATGMSWALAPDKPVVHFHVDSVHVSNNQSALVHIALDAPATQPLTVRLLPIDRNGHQPAGWYADTLVVFNTGEQTKPITVTGYSLADVTHYLLLKRSDDYLVGCSHLLKVHIGDTGSTDQPHDDRRMLVVYPNPTQNYFSLEWDDASPLYLEMFDVSGRLVLRQTVVARDSIALDGIPQGLYKVKVRSGQGTTRTGRLVVN